MKRRDMLKTFAITTGIGLAGCSSSSERPRSEKLDNTFKIHQWLREGESIGTEEGDEHWRILVDTIYEDNTIDLIVEKTVMDETGANKEGQDPMYTFERKKVEVGDSERIEDDFIIVYIDYREDEAHIGFDDSFGQGAIEEVVKTPTEESN